MRKLIFLLVLAALLTACNSTSAPRVSYYGGHSEDTCELNWDFMKVKPGDEKAVAFAILRKVHTPDSVGDILKECINDDWQGWR